MLCGLGRTGRWFASEHYGVVPDIVTLGKGMAGGALALAAVGVQAEHFEVICRAAGGFQHGGTFSHHQVACAAGNAVMDILESENLVARVRNEGPVLGQRLIDRLGGHPNVGEVRGLGFLWGVEFVADRDTRRPFTRKERLVERIWDRLFDNRVLLYKSTGLAGADGDAMVIGPPFIIAPEEMDRIADSLAEALDFVLAG